MAQDYNIKQRRYNGTDWDTLYPLSKAENISYNSSASYNSGTVGKALKDVPPMVANNKVIGSSAWTADSTYTDFPYKALIIDNAFANLVSTDIPTIVLHPTDAMNGIVAPICSTYINGSTKGIYIYASEIPTESVTVLTAYAVHTQN